jgi:hypothetical protein
MNTFIETFFFVKNQKYEGGGQLEVEIHILYDGDN